MHSMVHGTLRDAMMHRYGLSLFGSPISNVASLAVWATGRSGPLRLPLSLLNTGNALCLPVPGLRS